MIANSQLIYFFSHIYIIIPLKVERENTQIKRYKLIYVIAGNPNRLQPSLQMTSTRF